jgi:hypothetical protein
MSAIVYFEIHYNVAERARKFYSELFGWKIEKNPGTEYWMISSQDGSHGGMMKRFNPNQKITGLLRSPIDPGVFSQSGEVGRQNSRTKDGCSQGGLFCIMHGFRGQCLWSLGR